MAEAIYMPKMSDTMEEGVIVKWLKKVGDPIKEGDILAEVETDKAVMELEAYNAGTLLHIGVQEKEAVPVDALIAVVGDKGEDYQSLLSDALSDTLSDTASPEKETTAPQETASPSVSAPSPDVESASRKEKTAVSVSEGRVSDRIKASPLAKRLAKEKGYALQGITGTGEGGRIVKQDVERYVPSVAEAGGAQVYRAPVREERYRDTPLSQMRKTIARRLCDSKFSAPHFYLSVPIRMDRAISARKRLNELSSVKISFNDMVVKACAAALGRHPQLNVSLQGGDVLREYEHVHLGVAIAVPEGLLVPVLRFADTQSLSQISQEIKGLAQKAKDKALQPADWEGSTFSVSNLGMYGIETFTAIINPPNACILAVGAIMEEPVVEKGELRVGHVMRVTLSCDHRVVDGAMGADFLQTFKSFLEDPVAMLL